MIGAARQADRRADRRRAAGRWACGARTRDGQEGDGTWVPHEDGRPPPAPFPSSTEFRAHPGRVRAALRGWRGGARALLAFLAALVALAGPAFAQASEPCPDGDPTPTAVAVDAVPIVVASTPDDYFVLYVTHDVDGTAVEMPVLVKRGEAGTTTLAENVEALPMERYRVEQYLIADPADVDGDCIDDITELADPVGMSPVNAAAALALTDGAVAVPDTHTYDALAVGSYFKFALLDMDTDRPSAYFINAKTHPTHQLFLDDRNISRQRVILGAIAYNQNRVAPDGSQGVYRYSFNTLPSRYSFSFSLMERTHTLLAASMPLLEDNLALYVRNHELPHIQSDFAVVPGIPHQPRVRRGHLLRHRLPGVEPGGRVWPAPGPAAGRPAPPARRGALRGAAQRAAPASRGSSPPCPKPRSRTSTCGPSRMGFPMPTSATCSRIPPSRPSWTDSCGTR